MNGDVFSAGIILFSLLTGYFPYNNKTKNIEEILEKNKEAVIIFKANAWGKISEAGRNMVQRMLLRDPKERIDVKEALEHPWV